MQDWTNMRVPNGFDYKLFRMLVRRWGKTIRYIFMANFPNLSTKQLRSLLGRNIAQVSTLFVILSFTPTPDTLGPCPGKCGDRSLCGVITQENYLTTPSTLTYPL
jgi:hypothetical protein